MKKRFFPFIVIPFLLFFGLRVGAVENKQENWQDESIYYLMIDRFNNGDSNNDFTVKATDSKSYHGGDFKGITQQLDYIKDMGFTSICLTPIFDNENNGYHGYWTADFYKIEEHFGSLASFKKLVSEVHKRDMKIIVEFDANSVGLNHPWLTDSDKAAWFHEKQEFDGKNSETAWIDGLPDLAQENSEVQQYLVDAAKWWVKETNIDGYKLLRMQNVPEGFWKTLSDNLKKNKSDIFLIGDADLTNAALVGKYNKIGVDSVLDYPGNLKLRTAFAKTNESVDEHFSIIKKNKKELASPNLAVNFMDNSYSERFTRDSVKNNLHPGTRWKLALTYMYTIPGIPMVYYGSEIALDGGAGNESYQQMDFRTDKELIDYITKIGELRNQLPSLTKGSMTPLVSKHGMTVFKREFDGEVTVIAINNSSKSQTVQIASDVLDEDKELRGLLSSDLIKNKDGQFDIIIDRDEAEIYLLSEKSGVNIPYILAMAAVYSAFVVFLVLVFKRSKRKQSK